MLRHFLCCKSNQVKEYSSFGIMNTYITVTVLLTRNQIKHRRTPIYMVLSYKYLGEVKAKLLSRPSVLILTLCINNIKFRLDKRSVSALCVFHHINLILRVETQNIQNNSNAQIMQHLKSSLMVFYCTVLNLMPSFHLLCYKK